MTDGTTDQVSATAQRQGKARTVHIDTIQRDPEMQVRVKGVDNATVNRYATALRANPKCMPPITLADVAGKLLPTDGWHRLAAYRAVGLVWVKAEVISATRGEALWMAASANLKNPRPLTKADLLNAFRMYITAKRHRTPKGGFKSYREIAVDFANVKSHQTISNWMHARYPSIAKAMRAGRADDEDDGPHRRRSAESARIATAIEALRVAQENIDALGPPRDRPALLAGLIAVAQSMGREGWKPEDAPPF
jgi:hypothetical protein